jgi:hypothetical protein
MPLPAIEDDVDSTEGKKESGFQSLPELEAPCVDFQTSVNAKTLRVALFGQFMTLPRELPLPSVTEQSRLDGVLLLVPAVPGPEPEPRAEIIENDCTLAPPLEYIEQRVHLVPGFDPLEGLGSLVSRHPIPSLPELQTDQERIKSIRSKLEASAAEYRHPSVRLLERSSAQFCPLLFSYDPYAFFTCSPSYAEPAYIFFEDIFARCGHQLCARALQHIRHRAPFALVEQRSAVVGPTGPPMA